MYQYRHDISWLILKQHINTTTVVPLLVATLNRGHPSNKVINVWCYYYMY